MNVSHETIYKSLFIQARGVLKKELLAHLRSSRIMRRGRTATTAGQTRGQIIDAVSIRDRPPEIEDRAIPGHWEGDLLSGARNSRIATLVERSSRFVMLVKVGGRDSDSVVSALIARVQHLPQGVMASLTWDRGTELAYHRKFTVATDVSVYFCDPKSPWQRGSNENTNGLLRQYFPNGTDLSVYTQHDLDQVALRLNTRPRKTLGFQTPADTFERAVALTGSTHRGRNLFDLRALRKGGRPQLNRFAAAVKQLDPDMVFDLLDTPGKCGLGQVPPFSSRAERAGLRDGKDILQPFQSHGAP
jgi:IS30 family transposase